MLESEASQSGKFVKSSKRKGDAKVEKLYVRCYHKKAPGC